MSNTYETTLEIEDRDVDVEVDFDYDPPEKMTHDYPGCDEDVCVNEVKANGAELNLTSDEIDHLRDEILDWIHEEKEERWDR